MKVGYLGPISSFSHQACQQEFSQAQLVAYPSIPKVLYAKSQGEIDLAIVPVENSLEGSVHATIDYLFHKADLQVVKELILPIKQQLLVANDWSLSEIEKVISHPQALAQSQAFLEEFLPQAQLEAVSSTTFGAKTVYLHPQEKIAAIGSKQAAKEYGLSIACEDIQDNHVNQTRFWVIAAPNEKQTLFQEPADKMTILLTLPSNQPGALHKVLAAFGWREIDLSKIESRPLKTNLGEYFFVIDLVCQKDPLLVKNALEEISLLGGTIRNLGSYPIRSITEIID